MKWASSRDQRLEQLALARGAWGVVLLVAPAPVIDSIPGAQAIPATRRVARALGARHLIQAAATIAGSRIARRAWWLDALHSVSMFGVALAAPAERRVAVADGLLAAGFAAATYSASRGSSG